MNKQYDAFKNNKGGLPRRGLALICAVMLLLGSVITPAFADTVAEALSAGGVSEEAPRPICGLEEGQSVECARPVYTGRFEAHVHSDSCYDASGRLACGYVAGEYFHTHSAWCYDADGALVCGVEERAPHRHGDECYVETRRLICGREEAEGHAHTDACYTETRVLNCGLEEKEGHTHSDTCYVDTETLICGLEESDGHLHTAQCYEDVDEITCGLEESDGHVHTQDCYTEVLTCGQEESEAHAHTADCLESRLTCGVEAGEGAHHHGEGCHTTVRRIVCGVEAGEGAHHHDENCYGQGRLLVCGREEEEPHAHTDACYRTERTLTCELEESEPHAHTDACYEVRRDLVCQQVDGAAEAQLLGLDSLPIHVHDANCFEIAEDGSAFAICGYWEIPEFVSDADCWTEESYTVAHVHSAECYAEAAPDEDGDDEGETPQEETEVSEELGPKTDTGEENEESGTNQTEVEHGVPGDESPEGDGTEGEAPSDEAAEEPDDDTDDAAKDETGADKSDAEDTEDGDEAKSDAEDTEDGDEAKSDAEDTVDDGAKSDTEDAADGDEAKSDAEETTDADETKSDVKDVADDKAKSDMKDADDASDSAAAEADEAKSDGDAGRDANEKEANKAGDAEKSDADDSVEEAAKDDGEDGPVPEPVVGDISGAKRLRSAGATLLGAGNDGEDGSGETAPLGDTPADGTPGTDEGGEGEGDDSADPYKEVGESLDLMPLLTKVEIFDLQTGEYVGGSEDVATIKDSQKYRMSLTFAETADMQFPDNMSEMIYSLTNPDGKSLQDLLSLPERREDIFSLDLGGGRTLDGNRAVIDDGKITVTWNTDDLDAFERLIASAKGVFTVNYVITVDLSESEIKFSDTINVKVVEDTNFDVYVTKKGRYLEDSDLVEYTVEVTSDGKVRNVKVEDVISGEALSYVVRDAAEPLSGVTVGVGPRQPQDGETPVQPAGWNYDTMDVEETASGFSLVIPELSKDQKATLTYYAKVDYAVLDGKVTAEKTMNTVTATGPKEPSHASFNLENNIPYLNVEKKAGQLESIGDNRYRIPWTVTYNKKLRGAVEGAKLTDTIYTGAVDAMSYDRSYPFNVIAYDKYGNAQSVKENWDGVDVSSFYVQDTETNLSIKGESWEYTLPGADEVVGEGPHWYEITYYTIVDADSVMLASRSVGNKVDESITHNSGSASVTVPKPSEDTSRDLQVDKEFVSFRKDADGRLYAQWQVRFDRRSYALEDAYIEDTYPHYYDEKGSVGEPVVLEKDEDYAGNEISIHGLMQGERWEVVGKPSGSIFFRFLYSEGGTEKPGLNGKSANLAPAIPGDSTDEIVITYYTRVSDTWLINAVLYDWPIAHKNEARLIANGQEATDAAECEPRKPMLIKEGSGPEKNGKVQKVGTMTVDDMPLPVYRYTLRVAGVEDELLENGSVTITDEFDADLVYVPVSDLTSANHYEPDMRFDADKVNTMRQIKPARSDDLPVSVDSSTPGKLVFTLSEDAMKQSGKYGLVFEIPYYLMMNPVTARDEAEDTLRDGDEKKAFSNSASWKIGDTTLSSNSVDVEADLKPIHKNMEYSDQSQMASFTIEINPMALELNGGAAYRMTDSYENMAIDFNTVRIETYPSASNPPESTDVEWAYHSNQGVFWIPDRTRVVITYKAWPKGDFDREFSVSNTASIFDFSDTAERTVTLTSEHTGFAANYSVQLFKFADNNMDRPLRGAVFQLFEESDTGAKVAMTYPIGYHYFGRDAMKSLNESLGYTQFNTPKNHGAGENIYFTTDENGAVEVMLSMAWCGVVLEKGRQYYLLEVQEPEGFHKENIYWSFIISDMDDFDNYVYRNGGVMQVSNASDEQGVVVYKHFAGDEGIPYSLEKDISFRVIGTSDGRTVFDRTVPYSDFSKIQREEDGGTVTYYRMLIPPQALRPGHYTVTELNADIPGYTRVTDATLTYKPHDAAGQDRGTQQGQADEEAPVAEFDITEEDLDLQNPNAYVVDFTNRYTVELEVSKAWAQDLPEGWQPESAVFQVYRDGTPWGDPLTLDADNGWTQTLDGLPRWDEDGNAITWSAKETGVTYSLNDSRITVSGDEDVADEFDITVRTGEELRTDAEKGEAGWNAVMPDDRSKGALAFTNAPKTDLVEIRVQKAWEGADEHPEEPVHFTLYRTTQALPGSRMTREEVKRLAESAEMVRSGVALEADGTVCVKALDRTDRNGNEYHYFAVERSMAGWTDSYTVETVGEGTSKAQSITITNEPTENRGTLTVNKTVVGLPDADGREFWFTVMNDGRYLYENGELGETPVSYSVTTNRPFTFNDVRPGDYTLREIIESGAENTARVEGFKLSVKIDGKAASSGAATITVADERDVAATASIENTYTDKPVEFVFGKLWVGPGAADRTTMPWPTDQEVTFRVLRRIDADETHEAIEDADFDYTYTIGRNDAGAVVVKSHTEGAPEMTVLSGGAYNHYRFRLANLPARDAQGRSWVYYAQEQPNDTLADFEAARYGRADGITASVVDGWTEAVHAMDGESVTASAINRLAPPSVAIPVRKILDKRTLSSVKPEEYRQFVFLLEETDEIRRTDDSGMAVFVVTPDMSQGLRHVKIDGKQFLKGSFYYTLRELNQEQAGEAGFDIEKINGVDYVEGSIRIELEVYIEWLTGDVTTRTTITYPDNSKVMLPANVNARSTATWTEDEETCPASENVDVRNPYDEGARYIPLTKLWDDDDNQDGLRGPVTFQINYRLKDGSVSSRKKRVTRQLQHGVPVSVKVPMYVESVEIEAYIISEVAGPEGYKVLKDGLQYAFDESGSTESEAARVSRMEIAAADLDSAQGDAPGYTVTNRHDPEPTTVSITKAWNDDHDRDGLRLSADEYARKVHLYADGELVDSAIPTVTDNGDDTYTVTFEKKRITEDGVEKEVTLPKYKKPGTEIVYTVKEDEIEGYTSNEPSGGVRNKGRLTNRHDIEKITFTLTKTWLDAGNQDGIRPTTSAYISYVPLSAGNDYNLTGEPITVTCQRKQGDDNVYIVTYTAPKYERESHGAVEIVYIVPEEKDIVGYIQSVALSGSYKQNYTVTNAHTPVTVDVSVTKVWEGDEAVATVMRPDELTVRLTGSMLVNGREAGSVDFTNAAWADTYGITETTRDRSLSADNSWTGAWTGLPRYTPGKEGVPIQYSVEEETIPLGYRTEIDVKDATASDIPSTGISLVARNIYETVDVPVTKVWDDGDDRDDLRPASVTVSLTATIKGEGGRNENVKALLKDQQNRPIGVDQTLDADNDWSWTWEDLPAYAKGRAISYSIVESPLTGLPAGYTSRLTGSVAAGYTLKNTHEVALTRLRLTKTWVDEKNRDAKRPTPEEYLLRHVRLTMTDGGETFTVTPRKTGGRYYLYKGDTALTYNNGRDRAEVTVTGNNGASGAAATDTYVLNFVNLPLYDSVGTGKVAYSLTEVNSANAGDAVLLGSGYYTAYLSGVAQLTGSLPSTEVALPLDYDSTDGANGTYVAAVTNEHPKDMINISIKKVWSNPADTASMVVAQPDEILVQLYADDKKVGDAVPLNAENEWSYIWSEQNSQVKNHENAVGRPIVYTVREVGVPKGYTMTVTRQNSTAAASMTAENEITNTYKTGTLAVAKTLVSDVLEDANHDFHFRVRLTNLSDFTAGDRAFTPANIGIVKLDAENHEIAQSVSFDADGVSEFTLKGGERLELSKLPVGMTYSVEEYAASGEADYLADFTTAAYNGSVAAGTNRPAGEIADGATARANFTNTRKQGGIKVVKAVTSHTAADHSRGYAFTVTLDGEVAHRRYGDMDFSGDGLNAALTLSDGESAVATGLPAGIGYTVTETAVEGMTTTFTGKTGIIDAVNQATTKANITQTAAFANVRREGALKVEKTVDRLTGPATLPDVRYDAFTFTVTLSDKTDADGNVLIAASEVNGAYGGMSFTAGVATFTLKHGESRTATGLPEGLDYVVAETGGTTGYTTVSTGDTGTITSDVLDEDGGVATDNTSRAAFTNTRDEGALTVSKEVVSDLTADIQGSGMPAFSFTVTLGDGTAYVPASRINGAYGDMTFTGGVATFTLKHGESRTATGLPAGLTYEVSESADSRFTTEPGTLARTGAIAKNVTAGAAFTNTRKVGSLTIGKRVESDVTTDASHLFRFRLELDGAPITTPADDPTRYGDLVFKDGVAEFTLAHDHTVTARNLPTDATYSVTELETGNEAAYLAHFDTVSRKGSDEYAGRVFNADGANIVTVAPSEVDFTNTRRQGGIIVSKSVVSSTAADHDRLYAFTVTLDGEVARERYGDMDFSGDGLNATITLSDGESAVATGLPAGIGYTVTETAVEGMTTTFTGKTGTVEALEDASNRQSVTQTAAFLNTRREGALTVSKTVSNLTGAGTLPNVRDDAFTFTVTLRDKTDADGNVLIAASEVNGKYGGMRFARGKATFTLKHGESRTATGLPEGLDYTVEETGGTKGYTVASTGETGTIASDTLDENGRVATDNTAKAEFINTRDEDGLLVAKRVVSDFVSDTTAHNRTSFSFTVTLGDGTAYVPADRISGLYGDMTFTNGVARFTLKNNEGLQATGLPEGLTYTVTEAANDDFATDPATLEFSGSIVKDRTAEAVFTNTRRTGSLTISKAVAVQNRILGDNEEEFEFEITLTHGAQKLENTYGGVEFKDGKAVVKVSQAESRTIDGIPVGTEYTVTELPHDGFEENDAVARGTMTVQGARADFTNIRRTGRLTIRKNVISPIPAEREETYSFTVELQTPASGGAAANGSYAVTALDSDGEPVGIDALVFDGQGRAVLSVPVKGSDSVTLDGLPVDLIYTVHENADTDRFDQPEDAAGTISATPSAHLFTNERRTGALEVRKALVSDASADAERYFDFTVTLADDTITGSFGDMRFENGVAELRLRSGDSLRAEGLPVGLAYTVEERGDDVARDFIIESENTTGTITADALDENGEVAVDNTARALITNIRRVGELTLTKRIESSLPIDQDARFEFTVALTGAPITTDEDHDYGDLIFEDGVAHVTLGHGESATAINLPVGTEYSVTEGELDGYSLLSSDGETGVIGDEPATAAFVNAYAASGKARFSGVKRLLNRGFLAADRLTVLARGYKLDEATRVTLPLGADEADFAFAEITFDQNDMNGAATRTFLYTFAESDAPGETLMAGTSMDAKTHVARLTLTDDGAGHLLSEVTYLNGGVEAEGVVFENRYSAVGALTFKGTKTLTGRALGLDGDVFDFEIVEDDRVIATGHNDPDTGAIDYPTISYALNDDVSDLGTHTYIVREAGGEDGGIRRDENTYTVTVRVEDNGDGTLTTLAGDNGAALDFTNAYTAEGSTKLYVQKKLTGRAFAEGDAWTFTLTGSQDAPMPANTRVTIAPTGGDTAPVDFGEIHFTQADIGRTYTYTVSESGGVAGVKNDPESARAISVSVNYDPSTKGLAIACDTTEAAPLTFTNVYEARTELTLDAVKRLKGRTFRAGDEWTFTVIAAEGTPMPDQPSVTIRPTRGDRAVARFGAIRYTQADLGKTYDYTIIETGDVKGVANANPVTVSVTVERDPVTGGLALSGSALEAPEFENIYTASGTKPLECVKTLSGREFRTGDVWSFELSAEDGAPMPENTRVTIAPESGDSATVSFGSIEFNQDHAGRRFTYRITESGEVANVTNDPANPRTVVLTVKDNGDGTLSVLSSADSEAVVFVNVYEEPPKPGDDPQTVAPETNPPTPETTVTPVPDATPAPTDTPAPTETPAATDTPAPTETPAPTDTPVPTNTPIPTTTIVGTKVWVDDGDAHHVRPESVTVRLYANGRLLDVAPGWDTGEGDTWSFRFAGMPMVDENGAQIRYTVSEEPVKYYRTEISGTRITNTLIPGEPEGYEPISGNVEWDDDDNRGGKRPTYVTVRLLRDGEPIAELRVTGDWHFDFGPQPTDDGYGHRYVYELRADAVEDYFVRVQGTTVHAALKIRDTADDALVPMGGEPESSRDTGTPKPNFGELDAEKLEELMEIFDFNTPLWGMLLPTGDETPVYPFLFGGAGLLALLVLLLTRRRGQSK